MWRRYSRPSSGSPAGDPDGTGSEMSGASFAPFGARFRVVSGSTGCATLGAASLHPWLQAFAPLGRCEGMTGTAEEHQDRRDVDPDGTGVWAEEHQDRRGVDPDGTGGGACRWVMRSSAPLGRV